MQPSGRIAVAVVAAIVAAAGQPRALGAQGFWADWTSATAPGAAGSVVGSIHVGRFGSVGVSYSGEIYFSQVSGGTDYWTPRPPAPNSPYVRADLGISNPTNADIIALQGGTTQVKTVTFSRPVRNPIFALLSLGRAGTTITYDFDAPFEILSFGRGYWGGPGTLTQIGDRTLTGVEGHGAIRFLGTFSSISWTVPTAETWHGFTVGVQGVPRPQQVIPEPATVALMGVGLAAMGVVGARRRRAG